MAKDQVTGRFGSDEVELTNAATEATLQRILAAIDKDSAGKTEQAKKHKSAAEGFARKLLKGTATAKDFNQALRTATRSTLRAAGRGLGHVADAAVGITEEFVTGSARISDFTSHLAGLANQIPLIGGLIGGPFQLFASFMDNNIDTFRAMSAAGIQFSNSVFSVQEAATRSGLSLDVFANALGSSSNTLALLEGNARRGAERFTRLSDGLRETRLDFSTLGLTMEDTTEFMTDYLAIQTRLGRAQIMTDNQLIAGTTEYIKQLDRLARITGVQREELSKQMESAAIDERLAGFLAQAEPGVRQNILNTISALETISPEIAEAFKGLIATGGVPMNDLARSLLIADSSLGDLARRIGTDAGLDAAEVFQALGRAADNVPDQFLQLSSILPQMGNNILAAVVPLQRFSNAAQSAREAAEDQNSALNAGSRGLLAFEQNIVALRNTILGTLINSGIFAHIEKRFNGLMENIDATGPFFTRLTKGVESVLNWVDKWILGLIDGEKTLGEVLSEIGSKISEGLGTAFRAGVRIIGQEIKDWFFSSPAVMATAAAVLFGPTVIAALTSAAVAGIGKLFASRAVVSALSSGLSRAGGALARVPRGVGIGAVAATGAQFIPSQEQGDLGDVARSTIGMAGTGAMIGSVIPGVGTLIGAGVGATLGLGIGAYRRLTRDVQEANEQLDYLHDFRPSINLDNISQQDIEYYKSLESTFTNLTNSLTNIESRINSLEFHPLSFDNLYRSFDDLETRINSVNFQMTPFDDLETRINSVNFQMTPFDNLYRSFDDLETRINSVNFQMTPFDDLETKINSVNFQMTPFDNLYRSFDDLETRINSVNFQMTPFNNLYRSFDKLTVKSELFAFELHKPKSAFNNLNNEIDNFISRTEKLSDLRDAFSSFNTDQTFLESDIQQVNRLATAISGFDKGFESISDLTADINNTTFSLEKMLKKLEEINSELKEKNKLLLDQETVSASQENRIIPTEARITQENSVEEVNRTLLEILRVLTQTQDLDRRQLNALRATSNNLYAG